MKTQSAIQWAQKMMALGMASLLTTSSCSAQTTPLAAPTNPLTPVTGLTSAARPNV